MLRAPLISVLAVSAIACAQAQAPAAASSSAAPQAATNAQTSGSTQAGTPGSGPANAAANAPAKLPIAWVPTEGVTISGGLEVANGKAAIANNGTITAGDRTAHVSLARGGNIDLCSTTTVHLTRDSSLGTANTGALMIALDRGALEAAYTTGQYSDVVMTPDLRILISGPGEADVKLRVNAKGDTCVDNHGANAPYVTVSSQFEEGLYRVQPNQRVSFQQGDLHNVVDNEAEPCGCPPPPVSVANAGTPGANPAKPGRPVGGPSSTPADTAFPLAQSEGLAPAPPPATTPAVPPGQAHAQVTVPLVYNSAAPPPAAPAPAATAPAASAVTGETASVPPPPQERPRGFFHKVGHFFAKVFGAS